MTVHVIDRSGWGPGPWDAEPEDRIEWRHAGLPCLMLRNDFGTWCGYVGLPPWHRWHGTEHQRILDRLRVHGGLTYSGACQGPICHKPEPGEPDDVWWLGFDCNHAWDLAPAWAAHPLLPRFVKMSMYRDSPIVYRDIAYVRAEVEQLADQLTRMYR